MHDISVSISIMTEGLQMAVFHDQTVIIAYGISQLNETGTASMLLRLTVFRPHVQLGVYA
jgi:hypothetical protein